MTGPRYHFGGARVASIQRGIRSRNIDQLAEHGSVPRAAGELSLSKSYARVLWGEIVRGLGWQAQ